MSNIQIGSGTIVDSLKDIATQLRLANELKLCTELYKLGCITENDYKSRMEALRRVL